MEGPAKQPDSLNIVSIVVIGAVGALIVYASFTALQAFYNHETAKVDFERETEGMFTDVRALQALHSGQLSGYSWVDQNRELVTLPIERSMELVLAEASVNPGNLVPVVGQHDTPTIPAVFGRPPDNVQMPAPATGDDEAEPEDGAEDGADSGADEAETAADEAGAEPGAGGAEPAADTDSDAEPAAAEPPAEGAAAQPAGAGDAD